MERTAQQVYRENLIKRFTDPDLQDFVQSTINILSDGIDIDDINGLKLESKGNARRMMSFYDKIKSKSSLWDINISQTQAKNNALNIAAQGKNILTVVDNGSVGIYKDDPAFQLDVDGLVGSTGRVGNFAIGKVPADGEWHILINDMSGTVGFEAFAHIINDKEDRYGLTYGVLLMSEEKGFKNRIRSVEASSKWLWGKWFNKIVFRWAFDTSNTSVTERRYRLEMKSRTRQGLPGQETPYIYYRLAKIWDKQYETGIDLNLTNVHSTTYGRAESVPDEPIRNIPQESVSQPKRSISIKTK